LWHDWGKLLPALGYIIQDWRPAHFSRIMSVEKKQKFNYFSTTFTQCSRLKRRKPKGNAVKAGRELSSFAAAHFVAVAALGLVDYFSRLFGAPAAAYKM